MKAFVKKHGKLYKAYREGADWRITISDGKITTERWFSVWHSDLEASLYNALAVAANCNNSDITICDN